MKDMVRKELLWRTPFSYSNPDSEEASSNNGAIVPRRRASIRNTERPINFRCFKGMSLLGDASSW